MVDNRGPLLFVHAHPDDKTLPTGEAADIDEAAVALADTIVAVRSSDLLKGIQGITSAYSTRQPVPSAPMHPRRSS